MRRQGELRLGPKGLKWHEVKALDHLRKDAHGVVSTALARMLSYGSLRYVLRRWADSQLRSLITARTSESIPFFAFPLAYALRVFGQRLEIRVPLSVLTHRLHDWVEYGGLAQHASSSFVCMGEWHGLLAPTTNYAVMREAMQLYKARLHYKLTKVYERFYNLAQEGKPVWRNQVALNSQERIDDYFERFVALFHSIQAHGVVSVNRLKGHLTEKFQPSASRRRKTEWGERDIGVAIGPAGELVLLPGGKHRLAVATVLKISHVPVQVRMVHVDWLRKLPRRPGQPWADAVSEGIDAVRRQYL